MTLRFRTTTAGLALLLGAVAMASLAARSQSNSTPVQGQAAGSQSAPPRPPAKKASEVFKNIQVLKDLDAEQWQPAMQFIAASLGVECAYCHVEGAPEKDDKPSKHTAREMMQMTLDLNKNSFAGRRE